MSWGLSTTFFDNPYRPPVRATQALNVVPQPRDVAAATNTADK